MSDFARDLYRLAVDTNVPSVYFQPTDKNAKVFHVVFEASSGQFPISIWCSHMPSTATTTTHTFFKKLRNYGFTEMPLVHINADPQVGLKRKRVQMRRKIFYHMHFQPGAVCSFDKVRVLPRVSSPAATTAKQVALLQTANRDLQHQLHHSKLREAFLIKTLQHSQHLVIQLRQQVLALNRHSYDITDEDGNPVAGEDDQEVPASSIPLKNIVHDPLPLDSHTCTTPTSVACDDTAFTDLMQDLLDDPLQPPATPMTTPATS